MVRTRVEGRRLPLPPLMKSIIIMKTTDVKMQRYKQTHRVFRLTSTNQPLLWKHRHTGSGCAHTLTQRFPAPHVLTFFGVRRQEGVLPVGEDKRQRGQDGGVQNSQHRQDVGPVNGAVTWGEAAHLRAILHSHSEL